MYPNLRAEMARRQITGNQIAEKLGIWSSTFSAKASGKSAFTLDEAMVIKDILRTDISLEELFQKEDE